MKFILKPLKRLFLRKRRIAFREAINNFEYNIMHSYQRLPNNNERYFILFDHLTNKNVEPLDAFAMFTYLQDRQINSKLFVLKSNLSYARLITSKYQSNIIFVDDILDFLNKSVKWIGMSSAVLTSFGAGDNRIDQILNKTKFIVYVYIDHGVGFFKSKISLFSNKAYNYTIAQTLLTRQALLENNLWNEEQIIDCGAPRWDFLQQKKAEPRTIFIMFTYRYRFISQSSLFDKYQQELLQFISNSEFLALLEQNNIELKISWHPAIYQYIKPKLPDMFRRFITDASNLQHQLEYADLFITDYSSLSFSFMYLDKPVIFYGLSTYNELMLESDTEIKTIYDKLYNYCPNIAEVISKIKFYIENDFLLEESNKAINNKIFWSRDRNNCERLYNEISKKLVNTGMSV